MATSLGELLLELGVDPTAYVAGLEEARQLALNAASEIEEAFSLNLATLKPAVDETALFGLNEHLDLKQSHWKQVKADFEGDPLTPRVDFSSIDELQGRLEDLNRKQTRVTVDTATAGGMPSGVMGSSGSDAFSQSGLAEEIGRAVARHSGPGVLSRAAGAVGQAASIPLKVAGNAIASVGEGLTFGITQELTRNLGRGLSSSIERSIGSVVGSTELLGSKLGDAIASELGASLNEALPGEIQNQINDVIKALIGEEDILKANLFEQGRQRQEQETRTPTIRQQATFQRREDLRNKQDIQGRLDQTRSQISQVQAEYEKGANLQERAQFQQGLTDDPAEKRRLGVILEILNEQLAQFAETEAQLVEQESQLVSELEAASEQIKKSKEQVEAIKPPEQPQFYREAVREVAGGDVSEDLIPKLVVADEKLRGQGARAVYGVESNTVQVTQELFDAINQGELTLAQMEDLYHELRHGVQFDFGSTEGIAARQRGEILTQPVQATPEELQAIAPMINKYDPIERASEVDAEVAGRRLAAQRFERQEKQKLITDTTNVIGVGGTDYRKQVGPQLKGFESTLADIELLSKELGVDVSEQISGFQEAIAESRAKLDSLVAQAAQIESMDLQSIEQLRDAIGEQFAEIEEGAQAIAQLKRDFIAQARAASRPAATQNTADVTPPPENAIAPKGLPADQPIALPAAKVEAPTAQDLIPINIPLALPQTPELVPVETQKREQSKVRSLPGVEISQPPPIPSAAKNPPQLPSPTTGGKTGGLTVLPPMQMGDRADTPKPQTAGRQALNQAAQAAGSAARTAVDTAQFVAKAIDPKSALERAESISQSFWDGYKALNDAIKQGDVKAAQTLVATIKDNAARAKAEIKSLSKALGDDAKMGTPLGSQMANRQSQISRASRQAEQQVIKMSRMPRAGTRPEAIDISARVDGESLAARKSMPAVDDELTSARINISALKNPAASVSQALDGVKKSAGEATKGIAEFIAKYYEIESGGGFLETVKAIAQSDKGKAQIKDMAVNTVGFAASKVGAQAGIVPELGGDLIGALVARQAINTGLAGKRAIGTLKEDEAFKAADALKKFAMLMGEINKQLQSESMQGMFDEELFGDLAGFVVGNATANGLNALAPGLSQIPLKGAVGAMATVPQLAKLREKITGRIAESESIGDDDEESAARLDLDRLGGDRKKLSTEEIEQLKQLNALLQEMEKHADQFDAAFKRIDGRSMREMKESAEAAEQALENFVEGDAVERPASLFDKLGKTGQFALNVMTAFTAVAFLGPMLSDIALASLDVATQMESTARIFTFAYGSMSAGKSAMASVRAEAKALGIDVRSALQGQAQLAAATRGTALEGATTEALGAATRQATSVYGLAPEQAERVQMAIQQMASKGKISCYDDETEVLTTQGWLRWTDVSATHVFATRDIKTGRVDFVRSRHLVIQEYQGLMLLVQTPEVDLMITPDHRMVVREIDEAEYKIIKAKDLESKPYYYLTDLEGSKEVLVNPSDTKWVEYNGFVYCATVEHTTLFVRRNGKTAWSGNSEELRQQLGESLPGAFQIAARAIGVSTAELDKMLERGEVLSDEFLPKFAAQLSAETAAGVPGAAKSSQAAINNYQNAILELQESLGKPLLGARNTGLEVLANGLNAIAASAGVLVQALGAIAGAQIARILLQIASSAVAAAQGLTLAAVASKGLAAAKAAVEGLKAAFAAALPTLLMFVAIDAGKVLAESFGDAGGSFRDFATSVETGLKRIQTEIGNTSKDMKNFGDNLPKDRADIMGESYAEQTFVGGIVKGVMGEEEGAQFLRDRERRLSEQFEGLPGANRFGQTRASKIAEDQMKALDEGLKGSSDTRGEISGLIEQYQQGEGAIADYLNIGAELEQIQSQRRALLPGDVQGRRAIDQQEQELLRAQREPGKDIATVQTNLPSLITGLEDQQKAVDALAAQGLITQEDYQTATQKISEELDNAIALQDEFNSIVGETPDELGRLSRAFGDVAAELQRVNQELERSAAANRKAIAQSQISGGTTPGQLDFARDLADQTNMRGRISANQEAIFQQENLLQSPQTVAALRSVDINSIEEINPASLRQRAAGMQDSKQKELLNQAADQKETLDQLVTDTANLDAQLAESQAAAVQRLRDLASSVYEFYRGIEQSAKELELESQAIAAQTQTQEAQTRLKGALVGFQDSFLNEFVDSLINLVEALNKPMQDAIAAQQQILGAQNQYFGQIQQALSLQNQLPNINQVQALGVGGAIMPTGMEGAAEMPSAIPGVADALPGQMPTAQGGQGAIAPISGGAGGGPTIELAGQQMDAQGVMGQLNSLQSLDPMGALAFGQQGIQAGLAQAGENYQMQVQNIQQQLAASQAMAQVEAQLQAEGANRALDQAVRQMEETGRNYRRSLEDLQVQGGPDTAASRQLSARRGLERDFEDQQRGLERFQRQLEATVSQAQVLSQTLRDGIAGGLFPPEMAQFLPALDEAQASATQQLADLQQTAVEYQQAFANALAEQNRQFERQQNLLRIQAQQRLISQDVQLYQGMAQAARGRGQNSVAAGLEYRANVLDQQSNFQSQIVELENMREAGELTADEFDQMRQNLEALNNLSLRNLRSELERTQADAVSTALFAERGNTEGARGRLRRAEERLGMLRGMGLVSEEQSTQFRQAASAGRNLVGRDDRQLLLAAQRNQDNPFFTQVLEQIGRGDINQIMGLSGQASEMAAALQTANAGIEQRLDTLNDRITQLANSPRSLTVSTPDPVADTSKILAEQSAMRMKGAGL